MKNIYQKIYNDQKNLGDLTSSSRIRIMLAMINELNLQEKNILDIGCYDGTFLSMIKNRSNIFFGLEASDWGFEQSRKKGLDVRQYFLTAEANCPTRIIFLIWSRRGK